MNDFFTFHWTLQPGLSKKSHIPDDSHRGLAPTPGPRGVLARQMREQYSDLRQLVANRRQKLASPGFP